MEIQDLYKQLEDTEEKLFDAVRDRIIEILKENNHKSFYCWDMTVDDKEEAPKEIHDLIEEFEKRVGGVFNPQMILKKGRDY